MTASKSLSDLLRWIALLSYALFLYILFTLPGEKIPAVLTAANDKILHGLDFFLLALLAFRAFFYSAPPFFHQNAREKACGFSLLYGVFLEWAQQGVSGRDASFADWFADAVGILFAFAVFWISKLPLEY